MLEKVKKGDKVLCKKDLNNLEAQAAFGELTILFKKDNYYDIESVFMVGLTIFIRITCETGIETTLYENTISNYSLMKNLIFSNIFYNRIEIRKMKIKEILKDEN